MHLQQSTHDGQLKRPEVVEAKIGLEQCLQRRSRRGGSNGRRGRHCPVFREATRARHIRPQHRRQRLSRAVEQLRASHTPGEVDGVCE